MNERDHILILRSIAGETTPAEEAEVERRRAENRPFAEEYRRTENLGGALQQGAWNSFGPSFADRVLERLGSASTPALPSIADLMGGLFARFAPLGVALAIVIGAWNLSTAEEGVSTVEAALGLEPVDLAEGYSLLLAELEDAGGLDLGEGGEE